MAAVKNITEENVSTTYPRKAFVILTTLSLSMSAFCGCYRMPSDEDVSLIPTTNNPDVTRDCGNSMLPGSNF